MTRVIAFSLVAALAATSSALAKNRNAVEKCDGVVLRDTCNDGYCAPGVEPMWHRGQRVRWMAWTIQDGVKMYVQYKQGAAPARNVRLEPGCRLPKWR